MEYRGITVNFIRIRRFSSIYRELSGQETPVPLSREFSTTIWPVSPSATVTETSTGHAMFGFNVGFHAALITQMQDNLPLPQNTRCSTHTYHLRQQKFCCRRTACVEQFTGYHKTDHQLPTDMPTSENTLIQALEIAAHCDSWLSCAIQILLLAYLLGHLSPSQKKN